ncbi:MAG: hypothetical protein R3336_00870, partial [Phycisphaeraceae bacterium]|nr:hypothetical protein [Phycisphaeraceae bacterium]
RLELARRMRVPWPDRRSPSRLWLQRRTAAGRLSIKPGHDDYPALLAEALDCIAGFEADVPAAAQALGVSTSQLVKLLAHDPLALEAVNDHRKELGLHRMRP